ncbi:LexA family transcriptional regulator [Dryocola clanedunensis]
MNTIAERLQYLMDAEGLKQKTLAAGLNVTPQTVNNWLKRNSISREAAQQIGEKYGYSLNWLFNGNGNPKVDSHHESTIPPQSSWQRVDAWDSKTPLENDEVEVPFLRDIELAAGDGSFCEDDYNGFRLRFSKSTLRRVGANSDGSGVLCFPTHGNSMEPVIPNGATVAVDCNNKKIVDGKTYAINQEGWKRIKILYRTGPNKLSIRSYNAQEYPEEEVDLDKVEIIGKVFWTSTLWE